MSRFVSRHPYLIAGLALALVCWAFGPVTVGHWIGVHGRMMVLGIVRFCGSLLSGAF
jgi:uncharacterized membrane protein YgdD (TMEM256/DUF423 family)